ncbi:glycosyltransferase family 4 protein [Halobellus captivus]|uniref:glycosyltransferase family 4 protein n=1 Tax=Halobellus captivus TaxID=2592614 RepID=UPI0013969306|nr:glycosyltransferase [Halobellus captivus]
MIRVAVACNLYHVNQWKFAELLGGDERFDVSVVTDAHNYHALPSIDDEDIYHCTTVFPDSVAAVREYNPLQRAAYERIFDGAEPDVVLALGASQLRFLGYRIDFNPTVLLPQGGEVSKACGNIYWSDSAFKRLRYRLLYRPVFERMARHASEIWTSRPGHDYFRKIGVPAANLVDFDWGHIDVSDYADAEPKQYIDDDSVTVLGSFRRIRGDLLYDDFAAFFDAVSKLEQERDDFHVVIGGLYPDREEGETEAVIRGKIEEHELTETVTLLDLVPKVEIPRYLAGLDVYFNFQHTGLRTGGLGTVAKEAMAAGAVYASFDNPSTEYVIEHRENGIVLPRDATTLADTLSELIENTEWQASLAGAGRRTIEDTFSVGAVRDRVHDRLIRMVE